MKAALKGQKVLEFPERAGVGDDKVPTPPPDDHDLVDARAAVHHDEHDDVVHHDVQPTTQAPKPTLQPRRKPSRRSRRLTTEPTGTEHPDDPQLRRRADERDP